MRRAGAVVAGKYRVERSLGKGAEGGAGLVVKSIDLRRKEPLVLKFLGPAKNVPSGVSRSFLREVRLLARVRSAHVARVRDAGIAEDGGIYVVREYLAGQSVARALRAQGALPVTSAAEYVIQACKGIAEANQLGIVHGDVKPYNLYLVGATTRYPALGSIRIVDFGISRFAFSSRSSFVTSMIIGYQPPERLRADAAVDHRSDVWSLGATLYELLTAQAAFDASQTLDRLVTAILDQPSPDPSVLRPEIPQELAAIVGRCMAKDPSARFQSAGELATALLPFAWPRARTIGERAAGMTPWAATVGIPEPNEHAQDPAPTGNSPSLAPVTKTLSGLDASSAAPRAEAYARRTTDAREPEVETEVPLVSVPRWLGITGVAAAGLVVFSAIVVSATASGKDGGDRLGNGAAFAAQAQPSAALLAEPPAAGVPSAAPEIFQLLVRASPESAQITIDGTVAEGNPFRALYPKGGETHRVTATAQGYESRSEDVSLTSDVTVDLELKRSPGVFEFRSNPVWRPAVRVARPAVEAGESREAHEAGTSAASSASAEPSESAAAAP
jgi:hypothetical protein